MDWNQTPFQLEFSTDNGPEARIFQKGGMREDELDRSQIGMLLNNSIPNVVPFQMEEIDGHVSFRYSLIGMRRFSTAIQKSPPLSSHWEGVLLSLRNLFAQGNEYMLHRNGFVLHPDWMWISNDIRDIHLLYVPSRSFPLHLSSWDQWNVLFSFFERNGMPKKLLTSIAPRQWERETFDHRLWIQRLDTLEEVREAVEETSTSDHRTIQHSATSRSDVIGAPLPAEDEGETMRFSASIVSIKEALALGLAFLGWIGFLWMQTETSLWIALACSLPIGYVVWTKVVRRKAREDMETEKRDAANPAEWIDYNEPIEPLAMRTTLLPHPEETVLLSTNFGAAGTDQTPWVEVFREGSQEMELISIAELPFFVGREASQVQLSIDHKAVSRRHIEIAKTSRGYEVRDMGSKNGTFRNDQMLSPQEWVPLQSGDMLRLPGADIVFQSGTGKMK